MVTTVRSLGLNGIAGYEVTAECFLSGGLPAFDIVGLPDAAVREARERVRAAVKNCGAKFPVSRITVNLAPAGTKKAGTVYDLPIFVGLLAADGDLPAPPKDAAFHRGAEPHRCPAGRQRRTAHGAGRPGGRYPDAVRPGGQRRRSHAGGGIDRLRRAGRGRTGGPSEKRDPSLPRPGLGTGAGGNRPAGLAGRDGTGACKAGTGDRRGRWT